MSSTELTTDNSRDVLAAITNEAKVEPAYQRRGEPTRTLTDFAGRTTAARDYHPVWLNNMADDVTLEGTAMIGAVRGADAVRTIVAYIRTLYDRQEFIFAGPYGEDGFLEDYNACIGGEPIGNVVLIARNAAGQAHHIAANYRPRNTVLLLSRLLGEHFAGTRYGQYFAPTRGHGTIDMKLEVVTLPVSDVERAKHFYQSLGWRLDADFVRDESFRVVQLTPPYSSCSIAFGTGLTSAKPGSVQRLELVVSDIEAARDDLIRRGVEVGQVFHLAGGRIPGPDPARRSYQTYAAFSDPDGNGWLLQEVKARLPGRVWED